MPDLKSLPLLRINEVVRYLGFKADVTSCWWDGRDQWRYEVSIRRGPKKGLWSVGEKNYGIDLKKEKV